MARTRPPHAHGFDQIVLPRRGVLEMEIDGKGGRVDPGRAAVVPPGVSHAFAASGENCSWSPTSAGR
jgi:quercetin dioxygenase-like cupin family protein